jgi:integrase
VKNRATPIPESIVYVDAAGFPSSLRIYKIPCSRFYHCSCYLQKKYATATTKTEIKSTALDQAKAICRKWLQKEFQGQSIVQSPNFGRVVEDLIKVDQERVNKAQREQSVVNETVYHYNATLKDFFGRKNCKDINYQMLNDYVDHLNNRPNKKSLSGKTIKDHHFMTLKKILKHAVRLGELEQIPIFPEIENEDNPRGDFKEDQYIALLRSIDELVVEKFKVRGVPITKELKLLVQFMFNCSIRPGDAKLLQHKHIDRIVTTGNSVVLRLLCLSKVKPYFCISMPAGVTVYSELLMLNAEFTGREDYVFYPNLVSVEQEKDQNTQSDKLKVTRKFDPRAYAMSAMGDLFNAALERAKLKFDLLGKKRTLYSLRHTAIMDRLRNGVSYDDVGTNAGTSGEMIRRFYGSHLTSEMNADRLIASNRITKEVGSTLEHLFTEDPN